MGCTHSANEEASSEDKCQVAAAEHFIHDAPGTYPRLCRLSDGSVLCGFTSFEPDGQRVLRIARSVDGARTFAPQGEVARSSGDCDNISLLELPADRDSSAIVLAAFRNHDLDAQGSPTFFRITVCQSADGGRSWTFLAQAFENSAPFGLWEPFLRRSRLGHVQLFFSQELEAADQDTMLVVSLDRGRTWSAPVAVTGAGERLRDGMVGVASTRDRSRDALVMVLETTRRGTFSIECVVSYDDGATFGSRQTVYAASPGRNAGAPQIASFPDGTLAVVFMTDERVEGVPDWPRKAGISAVFGAPPRDGNIKWGRQQIVSEMGGSWPGVARVGDGAVLAAYEHNGNVHGRLLLSARGAGSLSHGQ
ncbi:glycoside hydrolase family 93 protein [Lasiosphaeria ovina]|uniref:Glycoside hydrolase family 93 protein n=1 Tax=Lasiosphaeria ovina TaxID=92902 RepID=A0AAE0NB21_9PEZI|nr:glycoside hydrolase family 93 protein [Lasiosphaeria ovina]